MARVQNPFLKILCPFLLFLLPVLMYGQTGTQPRQIEAVDTLSTGQSLPSYEDWIMVSMLDTIGVDDYRYHHARLNLPHLFINMDDSICFVLYEGADTFCVAVPEGTGVTDSTYQWILTVNGGAPDTITVNETMNLVQGTNITITQGATDVTFNVPDMRDTCLHSLTQLTDTTAQLTDCNGANRGVITFSSDQCIQDMVVANGIGSDTIFLTNCDGTNKDTVVFYPPSYNDSYIDSVRYEFGDSLTVWLLRVDTSGVIDSVPIYIPVDSINTDTQLLSYIQNGQFDTISISNGNSIYLFDQDSQTLNITDDTLYISRGNNVDLKPYLDNDTVPDYDFLIIGSNRVPDQPADIDSALFSGTTTSKRLRIGQDSLETGFNVLINGGAGPLETASSLSANLWRQRSRSTNEFWDRSQQSGFLYFRGGDTDLGTNGIYLSMQQGYSGDSILFSIANGQIGMSQYPNYRIDGTQADVISMYYPDAQGNINIAPVDTMKRVLADWDFVQLMDGDTSYYGSNQKDSLLPLTATTLDSLLWRPGVIRLGDTIAFKRGYDPAGFGTGLRNTYKPQLQIHNKINSLDIYHWFYPYIWLRNNKGDWSFRTHNQDTEVDSLPHYYEIGVESYYKATPEADPDTTYRQVVRVSSQANSKAFVLYQDSLQLSDYTPDDTDSTITGAQIGAVFIPWTNGVVKLVSLDTLNAALSVAASTPNITFFDRYNTGDSIALNLNATPDTAFVDLSWLKVTLSGDTLIQGGDTLFLPQGADSLGRNGTPGQIVFETATKAPNSSANLFWSGSALGIGTNSPTSAIVDVVDGSDFRIRNTSGSNKSLRMGNTAGDWRFTVNTLGSFAFVDLSTGAFPMYIDKGSPSSSLRVINSGQVWMASYNTTTFDAGSFVRVAGFATDGKVNTRTLDDLETDMGGPFQPAGTYDNYSNFQIAAQTGTTNGVFSGETLTINGAGIASTSVSGNTVTVTATEVDGSTTNEIQDLSHSSTATTHRVTLTNSGGDYLELIEGSNITLTTSGTGGSQAVTIAASSSGGGIYTGSGTVPTTTRATLTDNFYFRSEAIDKLQIGSSGVKLVNIDGGSVYVGDNGDSWIASYVSGSSYTRWYAENRGTASYFWIGDASGGGYQSNGSASIVGSSVSLSGTTASGTGMNLVSSGTSTIDIDGGGGVNLENMLITGNTFTANSGSFTFNTPTGGSYFLRINSTNYLTVNETSANANGILFAGESSADQLRVSSTSSYCEMRNEASTAGYIRISDAGDITELDASDRRLKQNINPINDSYEKVLSLEPVSFEMKSSPGKTEYGFIAQDYQGIFPEHVEETENGYLGIEYKASYIYTTAAVQQLIKDNEQQAAQIKVLTDQINKLYDIVNKKK